MPTRRRHLRLPTSVGAPLLVALSLLAGAAGAQVSGTVVDGGSSQPIAGATVRVQASSLEATSDASGNFIIAGANGSVVVVAAKKGYFLNAVSTTAPQTGLSLPLTSVPSDDNASYVWPDSTSCAVCHANQYAEWNDSPMAKAGTNTWVHDIYDGKGTANGHGGFVYTRDSPFASSNPESECRSCHQPEPWTSTPFTGMAPLTTTTPAELHGVTCVMCHMMRDVDESKPNFPGIFPGSVSMARPNDGSWTVQYGLLGDSSFNTVGQMQASYQPQLMATICGTCHQDKNDPDEDGNFEEDNGVISEPTLLEWQASAYADPTSPKYATCIDCHMPATDDGDACVVQVPSIGRPAGDVRSHRILGTTPEYLENAVSMNLESRIDETGLLVEVTIVNDSTGHHVPTGVTIRNMLLLVEAWRESDEQALVYTGSQLLPDLAGVGDPAQGYFAQLPGKLYAKVNHDSSGKGPVFFTDATGIAYDSRIPALQSDTTNYTFALPGGSENVRVRARLIYRRAWRALVDAKQWTSDGHGNALADLAAPHFGHLMASAEAVTTAPPPTEPPSGPPTESPNPSEFCSSDADCVEGQRCQRDGQCAPKNDNSATTASPNGGGGCSCGVIYKGSSRLLDLWLLPSVLAWAGARRRRRRRMLQK